MICAWVDYWLPIRQTIMIANNSLTNRTLQDFSPVNLDLVVWSHPAIKYIRILHIDVILLHKFSVAFILRKLWESKCLRFLKKNMLMFLVMIGVALGFGLGFGIRQSEPSSVAVMWLGLPGEIYMRLLKMTILPLVASSIIKGTSSLDAKSSGRLGGIAIVFIFIANTIGAVLAIILFFVFKPGDGGVMSASMIGNPETTHIETSDLFADLIRNLFPDNIVTSCFQKSQTKYTTSEIVQVVNGTNQTLTIYHRYNSTSRGVNILGLIIVCSLFGIAASKADEVIRKPFVAFFTSVADIVIKILHWIVWLTPIGIASLIAASLADVDDIADIFRRLGMFVLAHTVGILIHHLILVPILYFIIVRQNPLRYMAICVRPIMTAFAPSSAAIAMPEMMNAMENKMDIDKRITCFVIPLGAALIRIGSSLFICLSVLFLMNLEGEEIIAGQVLLVGLLTIAGSLAIPSIPSASIIIVLVVLSSFNFKTLSIGLLMALEWYNDRIRTTSNAMTIMFASVVLHTFCKNHLEDAVHTSQKSRESNNCSEDVLFEKIEAGIIQTKL